MTDSRKSLRKYEGAVFCFLAAVIIAVIALNTGLSTEPGKILPADISMRSGEMSENIISGVKFALSDVNSIKAGEVASGTWRLITFVHMDPFFLLALVLPESASEIVLLIGYFLRFGLCCVAMYHFLSKHLKLSGLAAALLAVMYTFSSQIVLTAQFASIMNMAILMPVVMSASDSYLQKRTWKSFLLVCISAFGLCLSGGYGSLIGLPSVVFISLLMCISLYRTFKMTASSWLKLLGGYVAGLAMDMVFLIPGLSAMEFSGFDGIKESFDNAKVYYTLYDLMKGTYALRSGGLPQSVAPVFYIGILTVVAIIVFALNDSIPVRLKVASGVIATVFYITCCSSFVNETLSVYGIAATVNSSKLICIEALLFLVAGIGLKNAKSLTRGELIASCLIPLAFMTVSNNASSGTTLASPIMISTFASFICASVLTGCMARERLTRKAKIAFLIAIYILVGVNTTFMMFNNAVQKSAVSEYFMGNQRTNTKQALILDNGFELPAIDGGNSYLIVPSDLRSHEPEDIFTVDDINSISEISTGMLLFEEYPMSIDESDLITQLGPDKFSLRKGANIIQFQEFDVSDIAGSGERIFIYCDADNGAKIRINADLSSISDSEKVFNGPFFTEMEPKEGSVAVCVFVDSESEETCHISRYVLNDDALAALKLNSGNITTDDFMIDISNVDGTCTLILPYEYADTKISVNGIECETFDFCGKLAVLFTCSQMDFMEVSIERNDSGILPGILISIFVAACLVAITITQMYNEKKKVSGEGTEKND